MQKTEARKSVSQFVVQNPNRSIIGHTSYHPRTLKPASLRLLAVATTRRIQSDTGGYADWIASSSAGADELSLGFNNNAAQAAVATSTVAAAGMWPPSSDTRVLNYSIPHDMGMVGLRDLFVVAPASSFHHSNLNEQNLMAEGLGGGNPATALGVGLGVIPLLTATPCIGNDHGVGGRGGRNVGGGGIQIWQNQNQSGGNGNNNSSVMQTIGSSSSTTTCQDCGNQAKKDCCHRRCRTCCKSRGYECSTHVKSTWVPASRRRERQLLASSTGASSASISLSGGSGAKKARLVCSNAATSHTSNSNTPPRSFETTSCHQDPSFKETLPGQILAPATFKCVKVTSINDGDDEFAYQAMVKIGGHVFKGFLYDQGEERGAREHQHQHGMPNISDLHLGGGSGMHKGGCSTSGLEAPLADVYGGGSTSGGGMLGGSGYGNPIIN